jgi:hypothetical protein
MMGLVDHVDRHPMRLRNSDELARLLFSTIADGQCQTRPVGTPPIAVHELYRPAGCEGCHLVAKLVGKDAHNRARSGHQFGLPGSGFFAAGNEHTFALEIEKHRKDVEGRHPGRLGLTRLPRDDAHR